MGINTVPQPRYSPDLAPCDFCLFPKLRVCRYETIEEIKEAVTKVIDTLTQENFHGAFQRFLKQYNKFIAAGGDYFEGNWSSMCVLSIKVAIRKKSGNLFNEPYMYFCVFIFTYKRVHPVVVVFFFISVSSTLIWLVVLLSDVSTLFGQFNAE